MDTCGDETAGNPCYSRLQGGWAVLPGVANLSGENIGVPGNGNATVTEPAKTTVTASLVAGMVNAIKGVSDLIFSPGRPPQVESNGHLVAIKFEGLPLLTPDHTSRIAAELMGQNKQALASLKEQGACDFSYGLPQHGGSG